VEVETERKPQTAVTTYRPVFTSPVFTQPTTGYNYEAPLPEEQLILTRPSTPAPGLPTLYGPPSLSRRRGRKLKRRKNQRT